MTKPDIIITLVVAMMAVINLGMDVLDSTIRAYRAERPVSCTIGIVAIIGYAVTLYRLWVLLSQTWDA